MKILGYKHVQSIPWLLQNGDGHGKHVKNTEVTRLQKKNRQLFVVAVVPTRRNLRWIYYLRDYTRGCCFCVKESLSSRWQWSPHSGSGGKWQRKGNKWVVMELSSHGWFMVTCKLFYWIKGAVQGGVFSDVNRRCNVCSAWIYSVIWV